MASDASPSFLETGLTLSFTETLPGFSDSLVLKELSDVKTVTERVHFLGFTLETTIRLFIYLAHKWQALLGFKFLHEKVEAPGLY